MILALTKSSGFLHSDLPTDPVPLIFNRSVVLGWFFNTTKHHLFTSHQNTTCSTIPAWSISQPRPLKHWLHCPAAVFFTSTPEPAAAHPPHPVLSHFLHIRLLESVSWPTPFLFIPVLTATSPCSHLFHPLCSQFHLLFCSLQLSLDPSPPHTLPLCPIHFLHHILTLPFSWSLL